MMISTKGRYALRVMIDLAQNKEEGYISLKEISKRQEISLKYLEAIIKILVQANFVTSMRGKSGGYKLSREIENYSVGEILSLTEGGLIPVNCQNCKDEKSCSRAEFCLTLPLWSKLDDKINNFLNNINLLELINKEY